MGSVPMNKTKLFFISFLIDLLILGIVLGLYYLTNATPILILLLFLLTGPIFYSIKVSKYRNKSARHKYEIETKSNLTNVKRKDEHIRVLRERSFSQISGVNNNRIIGEYTNIKDKKE